jgi:hypothetical protein
MGKVKSFLNKHKGKIAFAAGVVVTGIICSKKEEQAVQRTTAITFNETMDWFDRKYDDVKLRNKWEDYSKEHPENVKKIKF